jgi:hypothetical protein
MNIRPFSTAHDPLGGPPFGGLPQAPGPVAGQTPLGNPFIGRLPGPMDISDEQDSQYLWQGRGRVTYTYLFRLNADRSTDSKLQETAPGHLIFRRQTAQSNLYGEMPVNAGMEATIEPALTLSALNFWLRGEQGRMQFGNEKDARRLMQTFRLLGVQQTDTRNVNVYGAKQDAAVTLFVAQRARIPDLWLSTGKVAGVTDRLYLVLRKFEMPVDPDLDGVDDPLPGTSELRQAQGERLKRRRTQAQAEEMQNIPFQRPVPGIRHTSSYWAWVPYIAHNSFTPPQYAYTGKDPRTGELTWVGTYLYIGTVTDRYNSVDEISAHRVLASRCVFPTTYHKTIEDASKLPEVEISYAQ